MHLFVFILLFLSKFSTKKLLGGRESFQYAGSTTDSGGGGTGNSLERNMRALGLCCEAEKYLVGFCCLHTLQLTLSNAVAVAIGPGGLEQNTAMQFLHANYCLQIYLGFDNWKIEFERAARELYPGVDVELPNKRMAAPIISRWWTVGEAAKDISANIPIFIRLAKNVVQASNQQKLVKTASTIDSLGKEIMILADVKLIACFHDVFLNQHFSWMQKGDKDIGNVPGYLGRHVLLRYFLMHRNLKSLLNSGWEDSSNEKMEIFLKTYHGDLDEEITDPSSADQNKMTTKKKIQQKKVNLFFQEAFNLLEKHYKIFTRKLLFLALYGEQCMTQELSKLLLRAFERDNSSNNNNEITLMDKEYYSEVHGCHIDCKELADFLKEKIDLVHVVGDGSYHFDLIDKDDLRLLASEFNLFLHSIYIKKNDQVSPSTIFCEKMVCLFKTFPDFGTGIGNTMLPFPLQPILWRGL